MLQLTLHQQTYLCRHVVETYWLENMTKLILAATKVLLITTKDQAVGYRKYEIKVCMFQDYFKEKDYPSHSLKLNYKNLTLLAATQALVSCQLMFFFV